MQRFTIAYPGSMPLPAKCAGCGSTSSPCLDLAVDREDSGLKVDDIGAVLLCDDCFAEAAEVMGYKPSGNPDNILMLEFTLEETRKDRDRLRDALRRLINDFTLGLSPGELIAGVEETTKGSTPVESPGQVNLTVSDEGPDDVSDGLSIDVSSLFDFGTSKS